MKEIAASKAFRTPSEKSTSSSIAILPSSAMRASGLSASVSHDGQLIKMPVCEPTADQCTRQPLTPPHLQAHARMQEPHGKCRGE